LGDTVFVAGSFNEWNPGNEKYRFTKTGDMLTLDITVPGKDIYQFKFTRGNWNTPEVTVAGSDIENRIIKLESDTTLEYTIGGWKDDFPSAQRSHTASINVRLLDTAFFIPQLNRTRRVWIYLPEGYAAAKNKKHYPVLYMHDGQNIFDEYTAGFGEWGVDECIDSLVRQGKPAAIVVGVDCGPRRMNEYNPYDFEKFGEGEGDKYVDFITNTLKPFIDKKYRTKSSRGNTIIAGSSMGGLISYYAMLTHPDTFGNAGVFSPAFWTAPAIKALTDSLGTKLTGKVFFYMGELEGGTYVADMKEVADKLGANSKALIYTIIDPEARHNEQAWRKWFDEFYSWIMGDGFNNGIKINH
jgi:predicted alpha/beta superfamily hydrolase